jgi:hypothetical protein
MKVVEVKPMTRSETKRLRAAIAQHNFLNIDEESSDLPFGFAVFDNRTMEGCWVADADDLAFLVANSAEALNSRSNQS